jgi:hypothetical protein
MHRTITTSLLGIAILGAGQAALAGDIPGDKSTKATLPVSVARTLGTLETAGDKDWYRVTLKDKTDYTVDVSPPETGYGFIVATLRNAAGKALASVAIDASDRDTSDEGFEYHTRYGGLYFLEYKGDANHRGDPYLARIAGDCRTGTVSRCTLAVGRRHDGLIAYQYDEDWFRIPLTAGVRYRIDLARTGGSGPSVAGRVTDASGKTVLDGLGSGPVNFVPKANGTYFVAVVDGDFFYGDVRYSLLLAKGGP